MFYSSAVILGCLVFLQVMTSVMTHEAKVRMCYFTNWSQYRHGAGRFLPANIDPFLCTHILYAFAHIDVANNTLALQDAHDEQLYSQIIGLKVWNPNLKVLLAVGGGNHGTQAFEEVSSSTDRVVEFAENVIRFLRLAGFDGLDIDWEFPTEDTRALFQTFVRHVGLRFLIESARSGQDKLTVTVAVSGDPDHVATRYDTEPFLRFVDYILLMAYDLWGTWSYTLGHHSPLHPLIPGHLEQGRFSMSQLVDEWTSQGVPKEKLVLGLSTYGRSGVMSTASLHQPGDTWQRHMGTAGPFTRIIGVLSYFEMCDNLNSGEWQSGYSPEGQVPYAWNPSSLQYVCYDDTQSFEAKAQYIVAEGLAGAMFWALDFDDFGGKVCKAGTYPLLKKVKVVFTGKSEETNITIAPSINSNKNNTTTTTKNSDNADKNENGNTPLPPPPPPPPQVVTQAPKEPPSPPTQAPQPNGQINKAATAESQGDDVRLRPLPVQTSVAPTSGWSICLWVIAIFCVYKLVHRCYGGCDVSTGRPRRWRGEKEV